MSFHSSAQNIWLENGHILRAQLNNGEDWCDCSIDLNTCIGNDNGRFVWGGENFSSSANYDEPISCSLEGDDQVPVLRAQLADPDGNWHWSDINLGERIGNEGGNFVFH